MGAYRPARPPSHSTSSQQPARRVQRHVPAARHVLAPVAGVNMCMQGSTAVATALAHILCAQLGRPPASHITATQATQPHRPHSPSLDAHQPPFQHPKQLLNVLHLSVASTAAPAHTIPTCCCSLPATSADTGTHAHPTAQRLPSPACIPHPPELLLYPLHPPASPPRSCCHAPCTHLPHHSALEHHRPTAQPHPPPPPPTRHPLQATSAAGGPR